MNKNKKILHSVVQNDPSVDVAKRKLSNLSKSSKEHKKIPKERSGNYSMVKDKYYNQSHYNTDNSKHKRSSSDSQKLYDLNKWSNFNMPVTKHKSKTNENLARIKKNTRKPFSKDHHIIGNQPSNYNKSLDRNSIQLDKFYNPSKGYDTQMILVTPRSYNLNGPNSGNIYIINRFYSSKEFIINK